MNANREFSKQKIIKVSNLIPSEFCKFFTHVLLRCSEFPELQTYDPQTQTKAVMGHHIMFDTILEYLWPAMEAITQEELLPTYSYARLYSNNDELAKHVDRPACEVSVTIQLAKSHDDYTWPIYMDNEKFNLVEGDGVIYSGCDTVHWREPCNGPEDFYSGQLFLHYVRKNGPYANQVGDPLVCHELKQSVPLFIKNRVK
jgi:hypothetical protein